MDYFWSRSSVQKCFGSTHVVEQLLSSTVPSILTFDFDLFLGSLFTFWDPNGLYSGSGYGSKIVMGLLM